MAKEFDIYLNKRLTECDIIVYSIPYRDGLTAVNRLIIESCLESYTLQKFIAVQTGSALVSHIDEMIKTCYERLNWGTEINVSAQFQTHYALYQDAVPIEIDVDNIPLLATTFAAAESALQVNAAPLLAYIAKSVGRGSSTIEFDTEVRNTLKQSLLSVNQPVVLDAEVASTKKRGFIQADSAITPVASMTNLCYRITFAADTAVQLAASVLGTEFHYSLGMGNSSVVIGASLADEQLQKFEAANSALHILSSVTESITQFMEPEAAGIAILADASPILKRHRLLSEMDADALAFYDDMTLEEIDYVIL